MIQPRTKTLYYSSRANKHYQSLQAALFAEAKGRIFETHPTEPSCPETGGGFNFQYEYPDRFNKLVKRLMRIYRRQFRAAATKENEE